MAAGSLTSEPPLASAGHVLEETGLEIGGVDTSRRGQQRPDFAAPDEPPTADLDALELPAPGPAADRLAPKADVGRCQQIRGFGKGDPVGGCAGHRRQSPEPELEPEPEPEPEPELEPDAVVDEDEVPDPSVFFVCAGLLSLPADFSLDDPPSVADPPSDEPPDLVSLVSPLSLERAAARTLEPRSFFAHPLPLKCIDGAEKTFVIVPSAPHSGQKRGPSASIPWTTSVSR
jgi:hypothetical protein